MENKTFDIIDEFAPGLILPEGAFLGHVFDISREVFSSRCPVSAEFTRIDPPNCKTLFGPEFQPIEPPGSVRGGDGIALTSEGAGPGINSSQGRRGATA